MKKILLCLATTILLSPTSRAAVIGVGDAHTGFGIFPGIPIDALVFAFGRDNDLSTDIFDQILLRPSDSGRTFTITSADDPEFENLVRILTNGVNDVVINYACIDYPLNCSGSGATEPDFFGNPGMNGIDFEGFAITSISLRLDKLSITHPRGRTVVDIRGAIIIEDESVIPEPSTLTLVGLGLLGLGVTRRRAN